jgi:hypothetical protein
MSKLKKAVLIVFTLLFVMNLQPANATGPGGSYDCYYTNFDGGQHCTTTPDFVGCDCDDEGWVAD